MPKYKTQITHSLGQESAVARLMENTEWARGISDLQGDWRDNALTFRVSIQGVVIEGVIEVEEDCLKLDARLPLVAMPFKSWMPNILRHALKKRGGSNQNIQTLSNKDSAKINPRNADAPVVLFLHIPKAGGTTLGEFVFNQCRSDEEKDEGFVKSGVFFLSYGFIKEPDSSVPDVVREILRRPDLRAVIGHFSFGIDEFVSRPSTYITLLRNPHERVVSLYHFLKFEDKMSIEEFVSTPPFKEADNDQTRRIAGVNPEIVKLTPAHLQAAKENLRRHFAVVGVTERFDETLVLLKRKLGWTKEIISFPRNVNSQKPANQSLSPQTVEAIRVRNKFDFELYEFANKLMDEAIAAEGAEFVGELRKYQTIQSAVIR